MYCLHSCQQKLKGFKPYDELKTRLAVITGASSGIGFHLAKRAAAQGNDLILVADRPLLDSVYHLGAMGGKVETFKTDLSDLANIDRLVDVIDSRVLDSLMANAGQGLGGCFLDHSFREILDVINTNVTGAIYLVQKIAQSMVRNGKGRILVTGLIVGFLSGSFHAAYNATKAFIHSFTAALRDELKGTSVPRPSSCLVLHVQMLLPELAC